MELKEAKDRLNHVRDSLDYWRSRKNRKDVEIENLKSEIQKTERSLTSLKKQLEYMQVNWAKDANSQIRSYEGLERMYKAAIEYLKLGGSNNSVRFRSAMENISIKGKRI